MTLYLRFCLFMYLVLLNPDKNYLMFIGALLESEDGHRLVRFHTLQRTSKLALLRVDFY